MPFSTIFNNDLKNSKNFKEDISASIQKIFEQLLDIILLKSKKKIPSKAPVATVQISNISKNKDEQKKAKTQILKTYLFHFLQ